nr:DUF4294 domain-containing protein [Bacteroidota bacterium]
MKNIFLPMQRSILLLILIISFEAFSQEKDYHIVNVKIVGTDTIPYLIIAGVEIFDFKIFKTKREAKRNTRLIRNIKKVYPYAKLAGRKFQEFDTILRGVESEREKRKIMKVVEKEINDEYGGELKKLTISQGKILIKLIDRETGNTSFNLVKELRGGFMAFFYQSFARIFGYNLKIEYDPIGEDRNIETIIRMIDNGVL